MAAIGAGRYQLGAEIARGAIGVVVRATDTATGAPVAVKRLRPETAAHPESVVGFLREADILARLEHPAIVRLRELLAEPDGYALVLDLVDGQDLRRRLRAQGPLAPGVAAGTVATVAEALAYLHGQGYLHGDIKPGNVVVPDDGTRIRLVDFGVARRAGEVGQTTYATPEYVSPEVVLGGAPGPAADVYALGMVLFELCCGRSAYRGGPSDDVLRRHLTCVPVPPPGLAEPLWPVISQCLSFDPASRPTAQALAAHLRALVPGLAGLVAAPPLAPDAVTWWLREADETAPVLGLQRVMWVPAARQNPEAAQPERLVAVPMPTRDGEPPVSTEPPTNINIPVPQPGGPVGGPGPVAGPGSGAPLGPPPTTVQPVFQPASAPPQPADLAGRPNDFGGQPVDFGAGPGGGRGSAAVPPPFPAYAPPQPSPEQPRKSKAPVLAGLAIAIVVLALAGIGVFLFLSGAFDGNQPKAGPSTTPTVATTPGPGRSAGPSPSGTGPSGTPSAPGGGGGDGGGTPTPSGNTTPTLDSSLIGKPLPTIPH